MLGKKDNFPLEGAKWPVLILDIEGKVARANQAAIKQLSSDGKTLAKLESVWTRENGCTSDEFVKRVVGHFDAVSPGERSERVAQPAGTTTGFQRIDRPTAQT
ncbi:MAG: hypothetical protein ACPGVU_26905, partial [Limisphaerales bacterium]